MCGISCEERGDERMLEIISVGIIVFLLSQLLIRFIAEIIQR